MFLDVVTQYFHGTMIVPWYFSPSTLEFNVNTMGQEFQYHGTKVLPRNAITYHGVANTMMTRSVITDFENMAEKETDIEVERGLIGIRVKNKMFGF